MRTAIISDLHLGSAHAEDVLRDGEMRQILLEEIEGADRLVLLGDVLELRELPLSAALEISRPFFEEAGRAMSGREILLIPGNHDHRLAGQLLEGLAAAGRPLSLEHRTPPSGEAAEQIAGWLDDANLTVAYPGAWLREDIYATHGHYMDCHMSLPRVECVAAAAVSRAFGPVPASASPEDYERVLRPIYGLADGLAQAGLARPDVVRRTRPSELAWRTLSSSGGARGKARRKAIRTALTVGVPAGVWAVNRLLHTGFKPDISASGISQSGIDAAAEMAQRLEIGAEHVITGHTHRAGPGDDETPWPIPGGGLLHNTGSWVFANAFHHPGKPPGPYWPGTVTWIEDDGPPRRVRLLIERSRDELSATVRRGLSVLP